MAPPHLRSCLFIGAWALFLLVLGNFAHAQGSGAPTSGLTAPGARCGFLSECSLFDEIGLHAGTSTVLRTSSAHSSWDAQGALRLSLTVGDVAEGGAAFGGHLSSDGGSGPRLVSSPVLLFARLRLLPLPWGRLALAPLRLALTYQHELVVDPFGPSEPPGFSRGLLRLCAGEALGQVDLDGSIGFVLAQPDISRPRPMAFDLSAAASVWLWRGTSHAPAAEFRLTAEALARFSLHQAFPSEQNLLVGFLGQLASGYGGGIALGPQVVDRQAGFLAMARLQVSWGKQHKNPWAERKAAEPKTTPEFIWKLLGAIDPLVGKDGCVWTDATAERPSSNWFCIGTPAADDPAQIVLKGGKRIPVGTHLWELGSTLRLDDGSKVVEIPLHARFRKAVWDYLDEHEREYGQNREKYRQQVCAGKVSILHGLENDLGTASMIALDDFGGRAALLAGELLQQIECNPNPSAEDQALMALNVLGMARSRGPLRARPPRSGWASEAAETESPAAKAGSGAPAGSVAEHTAPPRLKPAVLPAEAREHLFSGNLDKYGAAKGWHYEPTGDAAKGTQVLEPTRSPVDAHGVYEANVMVEGVKKKARSSFFPAHWSTAEVERAIEEAYRSRQPLPRSRFWAGKTTSGVQVVMDLDPKGKIQTAYPVYERGD